MAVMDAMMGEESDMPGWDEREGTRSFRVAGWKHDRLAGTGGVIGKIADVARSGYRPVSGLALVVPLVVLGKRRLVLGPVMLGHEVSSFSRSR
jgi:hypothetical protein